MVRPISFSSLVVAFRSRSRACSLNVSLAHRFHNQGSLERLPELRSSPLHSPLLQRRIRLGMQCDRQPGGGKFALDVIDTLIAAAVQGVGDPQDRRQQRQHLRRSGCIAWNSPWREVGMDLR